MVAEELLQAPVQAANRIREEVRRNAARARNGVKLAIGADHPELGQTPKDVVWSRDKCQLWRYRSDGVRYRPPLLIVFSLISRSYILDLRPGNSFVEHLRDEGFDVFLVDWGVPDERDAHNTLEDYVDGYLTEAVRQTCEVSGCDEVNLLGYCYGGVLTLLLTAHCADLPIRSLTTIATPVDMTKLGLFADVFRKGHLSVDDLVDDTGNVPPSVIHQSFRLLKPTAELAQYATLVEKLWSDEYVESYQAMTRWTSDHIPFAGATARQSADMLLQHNGLMTDRLTLDGRPVHLSDVTCPFLNVVAERDHIVPADSATPLVDLVGSTDKQELRLDAGHIGLAVGKTAAKITRPRIIEFLKQRSEEIGEPE